MDFLKAELVRIRKEGLFRSLRPVSSPQGATITIDGRRVLNFCSNDYLGLANDRRLAEAAAGTMKRFGFGSGSARLIAGNHLLHEELEEGLARLKGTESALLFNSGYHANIGVIPALAGEGDLLFSDERNHASLIDGCRLSKGRAYVYRHNDPNQLEDLLRKARRPLLAGRQHLLIVTESVFSMEGDLCPLEDLLQLAGRYEATVFLDEAHAVGIFGEEGEGRAPRPPPECLISIGTLGKAFGSYGAFVAGSSTLRNFLVNKARSFLFTTALPPAVVGATLAALKIVRDEPERRRQLWENVRILGRVLKQSKSPIFSMRIGDPGKTMKISRRLFDEGIFVQGIRPPTVPAGTSRLRITVTAAHTREQISKLLRGIEKIGF